MITKTQESENSVAAPKAAEGTTEAKKPKAETAPEVPETPEMRDVLLGNFTKAQKEYIIENLYPDLVKALQHFIGEAMSQN